jgi:RNA recognition motif-containing protein
VSGLSGEEHIDSLERKIRDLFSAKCTIESIDIKRSFNQQYSFAFLEIKETERLNEVIREVNGKMMDGNKIRVERQKKGG